MKLNDEGSGASICKSLDEIECYNTDLEYFVELKKLSDPFGLIFTITNIGNPPSLKPSDGFSQIKLLSKDGFLISDYKQPSANPITNQLVAPLTSYELIQESFVENEQNAYQIDFLPVNPLPSTGAIKLIYPE